MDRGHPHGRKILMGILAAFVTTSNFASVEIDTVSSNPFLESMGISAGPVNPFLESVGISPGESLGINGDFSWSCESLFGINRDP